MACWWNEEFKIDMLTKWHVDEMADCWNDKLTRWPKWQNDKLVVWQAGKLASWSYQQVQVDKQQYDQTAFWQDDYNKSES